MAYLIIIVAYSAAQVALGLWAARRLRGSSDFFVGARSFGPGLLFATFLAANIGGGSTIGATGLGYRDGLAAWWWVGSAAIGSLVLAAWVGPRIRRLAAEHDLRTVGDFLEWRYDARVRATIAVLLWVGTVAILAGQLIGIAWVLNVVIGLPKVAGCLIGAGVATAYFSAGGLRSSAIVNVVQVTVKVLGFMVALPLALRAVGGLDGLHQTIADPGMWNPWQHGRSGWVYVAMLTPAFVVSPGLLQKVYAARDDGAVRVGVGLNALALFAYALMPTILGMIAQVRHPGLPNHRARPADALHARSAVLGRRARPGRGVLRRAERLRRDPVHARDVAVAGSLQALRQSVRQRSARAQRRAPGIAGRRSPWRHRRADVEDDRRRAQRLLHAAGREPVRARCRRPLHEARACGRRPRRDCRRRIGGRGSATLERRRAAGVFTPAMCGLAAAVLAFAAVATLVPGGRPPSVEAARRRS